MANGKSNPTPRRDAAFPDHETATDAAPGALTRGTPVLGVSFPTNPDDVFKVMDSADLTIEKVLSLEPGAMVTGIFEGEGKPVDVTDPTDPSKTREVKTWKIRVHPRMVLMVMGASQLDRTLGEVTPGCKVSVMKNAEKKKTNRGMYVNDFTIGIGPAPAKK